MAIGKKQTEWWRSQPLVATLAAALRFIEGGNAVSVINQLHAFQNKVRAQVAPSDPALAATFLRAAQEVIDALSGGYTNPAGRQHGRFTAARHQPNGRLRLEFTAEPGAVSIVEASTNLVDWETIGVAREQADGTFTFEYTTATKFPQRFYRFVSP